MGLELRKDFPTLKDDDHYLDSNTRSHIPKLTIDAVRDYGLTKPGSFRKSIYSSAREISKEYIAIKEKLAKYYGGEGSNYAYLFNQDFGWNFVVKTLINLEKKPNIITSPFESHSVVGPILYHKLQGDLTLQWITPDDKLENDSVIVLSHSSSIFGKYRDLDYIKEVANKTNSWIFMDFTSSAGQTLLDLQEIGVDLAIVGGSSDLLAPCSSGFLYMKEDIIEKLPDSFPSSGNLSSVQVDRIKTIGGIEKFEVGDPDLASFGGMVKSIEYIHNLGMEKVIAQREDLISYLEQRLFELDFVNLLNLPQDGISTMNNSNICNFTIPYPAHDAALMLDETDSVKVRSGRICTHLGLQNLGIDDLIQVSTHVYTSKEDIDALVTGLINLKEMFG